jgi:acetylornithine deacetylase/succinyl-diaminopimelate desuccinylase-like protein
MMLTGATDGRFLTGAGVPTYGVPGSFLTADSGMHGLNEHVSVAALYAQRDYLFDLIQAYAATKDTQ